MRQDCLEGIAVMNGNITMNTNENVTNQRKYIKHRTGNWII